MSTKHNVHVKSFFLWYMWCMHIFVICLLPSANALHLTCTACEPGTYCFQDNSFVCPLHSNSQAISGNISDCICSPGYYKAFDAVNTTTHTGVSCQPCPAGSYCANDMVYACMPHSESLSLSSRFEDCKCSQGFTGTVASANDTNACQPCAAGLYKGTVGEGACEACAIGTYSETTQNESPDDCQVCPTLQTSTEGSDSAADCVCQEGYEADTPSATLTCSACVPGFFNAEANSTCKVCANDTYSAVSGAIECTACPSNSGHTLSAQTSINTCACDVGFSGSAGVCTACPPGSYGSGGQCLTCTANTYSDTYGLDACIPCPQNSESDTGASMVLNCSCLAGYEWTGSSCEACAPGFAKPVEGNDVDSGCAACAIGTYASDTASLFCENCPNGTFVNQTGQSSCLSCPLHSVATEDSGNVINCLCNAGYGKCNNCVHCESCAIGKYKNSVGNTLCFDCPIGYSTVDIAANSSEECFRCTSGSYVNEDGQCVSCPADSISLAGSSSLANCKCQSGFTKQGDTCTACAVGKYKSASGSQSCTFCPSGYIGYPDNLVSTRTTLEVSCLQCSPDTYTLNMSLCTNCPNNSQAPAGSDSSIDCTCNAGYTGNNGDVCVACPTGKYKPDAGAETCTNCPSNTYQANEAATSSAHCVSCPINSQAVESSQSATDCVCTPGFTFNNTACVSCAAGSYKPEAGNAACNVCPTHTYYAGTHPYVNNLCTECPANTQDVAAGAGIASCQCNPGYIWENSTCRVCTAGFYCPARDTEVACYAGSTSVTAAATIEDCQCLSGYYQNCSGNVCKHACLLCPVNSYCTGGNAQATACPPNATTQTQVGSTNVSNCVCNPGWYELNGLCQICTADTFCVNDQQFLCPNNSTALTGQGSVTECFCDAYFTRDAGNTCYQCGLHLVCEGVQTSVMDGVTVLSAGAVQVCAANATNINQKCVCVAGSYCNHGTSSTSLDPDASCQTPYSCQGCPGNSYCSNNLKTACPANTTSPINSINITQCKCQPGYYRTTVGNSSLCLLCPVGAFCQNELLIQCSLVDTGLTTLTQGAFAQDQCFCAQGMYRVFKNDTCKICPPNHFCPYELYSSLPNVIACGANEYSLTSGNHKKSLCVCDAGFLLSSEASTYQECLPCPPAHRCGDGQILEFFCFLENRTANADHSACVCLPGFGEQANGICEPCSIGTIKPIASNEACTPCANTEYYVNSTTCLPCGLNEVASISAVSCICAAPYVRDPDTTECVMCPENSFYEDGSCVACPLHSSTHGLLGQENILTCQCNPGYVNADLAIQSVRCMSCESGFYEVDGDCLACGSGAYTESGSTMPSNCTCNVTLCQDFVWSSDCTGSCAVSPEPCTECAAGHYKNFISSEGNTDECLQCGSNTYQPSTGQSACHACPSTRTNPTLAATVANACVCKVGFEENDPSPLSDCTSCLPGYFKQDIGNFDCTACAVGFFASTTESTTCASCALLTPVPNANATVSIASSDVSNCTCPSGYMLESNPSQCQACQQGSYKTAPGNHMCRLCGEDIPINAVHDPEDTINTYGDDTTAAISNLHCIQCPQFSGQDPEVIAYDAPMTNVSNCLCFAGYDSFDASTGCKHCSQGDSLFAFHTFKLGYGNQPCMYCAAGKFFVDHNEPCQQCVLHDGTNATRNHVGVVVNSLDSSLAWASNFEDCDCDLGHERISNKCYQCQAGFYRSNTLNRTCQPCGQNEYQDLTGQTGCKQCPSNSFADTTQNTLITQCLCEAGYEWDDELQECRECSAGFKKARGIGVCEQCPENTYSLAQSPLCTACGPNERSSPGSGSPFACNCKPGFGSLDGAICSICGNGTFAVGGHESTTNNQSSQRPVCQQCPSNKNSTQGSIDRGNCTCVPGHGDPNNNADHGAACSPCANGFYASGGHNIACVSCGYGAITDPPQAAFAFSCCKCDATRGLFQE